MKKLLSIFLFASLLTFVACESTTSKSTTDESSEVTEGDDKKKSCSAHKLDENHVCDEACKEKYHASCKGHKEGKEHVCTDKCTGEKCHLTCGETGHDCSAECKSHQKDADHVCDGKCNSGKHKCGSHCGCGDGCTCAEGATCSGKCHIEKEEETEE